jgi:16S rRNA (cytosine967-C5)-methyltransferase
VIAPARLAAYEALLAVARGHADLPAALARARRSLRDERDRALAGEIATGTLRWQAAFDRIVAQFSKRDPARLDLEIGTILRLSLFQLLHLDRIPAAAVVDDAVEMARKAGKRSAAGFVNALLRRASRERNKLPLPGEPRDPGNRGAAIDYLSTTLSHPRWLIERWIDRIGYDATAAWARFDNQPAPLTLRVNTLRTTRDALVDALVKAGVDTEPTRQAAAGLIVRAGNPLLTPLADQGLFVVQDEASQLVGEFVDARPGESIFDACASPGGKTTQMAAMMRDEGRVVAADVRPRRVDLLTSAVKASGARSVRILQADARQPLPLRPVFNAVLVDAPCSGLGTIRRDPDIRWRRAPSDLAGFAANQRAILANAAAVLRPGGRIIYSTCSSEPEENEAVVAAFLDAHPQFELARELRTLPFRDQLEAFYGAALVQRAHSVEVAG